MSLSWEPAEDVSSSDSSIKDRWTDSEKEAQPVLVGTTFLKIQTETSPGERSTSARRNYADKVATFHVSLVL